MKRLLSRNRPLLALAAVTAFAASPSAVSADLVGYSQDFEALVMADPAALSADGWLVFGNVFEMGDPPVFVYGYGSFPEPNHALAFSAIAAGEGGGEQGAQQLNVFSDYENLDHANNRLIESNVFQEQTVGAADVGNAWVFQFDAKLGNLAGSTTAIGFIKTLDPGAGFALTNFLKVNTTTIPTTWGTYVLTLLIDSSLVGQILQFGFANTATAYEGSGVFYDNVVFHDNAVGVPEIGALSGHVLHPASPNPFRGSSEIRFAVPGREAVRIDVYDVQGRRVARLLDRTVPEGQHTVAWSGRDAAGRTVASGTYFYRMETAGFSETKRLVKIR